MSDLLDVVLWIATTLGVGRVALSLFPPGRPGYHELRELPLTLATSWLLGVAALHLSRDFLPAGSPRSVVLIPWAAIAAARFVTLPGGLVPRHAVRHAAAGRIELVVALSLVALGLALAYARWSATAYGHGLALASTLGLAASLVVAAYGLESARRAPLARCAALVAITAAVAWPSLLELPAKDAAPAGAAILRASSVQQGAFLAASLAFALPFVRLADRRAGALAVVLGAAPLTFTDSTGLPFAMLAALVIAAPRPLRARTAALSVLALLTVVLPGLFGSWPPSPRHLGWSWFAFPRTGTFASVALSVFAFAAFVAGAALVVAGLGARLARARASQGHPFEPPRREKLLAVALLTLGLTAAFFTRRLSSSSPESPGEGLLVLWPLVPVAVLAVALFAPPERVTAAR